MPKVSVIIPNYNHARYLDQRIQSVLNQTYQDFEVIFLDDASTDNSKEVVAKYVDDPRFSAVYNQVNSGSPFKQWNRGVREAQGEYIWIAESDDYADAQLLETLVEKLDRYLRVGIAYAQSWIVDEQNNVLASMGQFIGDAGETRWQTDFVNHGKDECRQHLVVQNTIPNASAVLIRRAVYEQVGWADESVKLCGDWLLWAKILLVSDVAFVAKPLNYFRAHPHSVRNTTVMGGTYIKECYQVLAFLANNVQIPRDIFEQASNALAYQWVRSIRDAKIPWQRNQEIYHIARSGDPHINRRLLVTVGRKLFTGSKRRLVNVFARTGAAVRRMSSS